MADNEHATESRRLEALWRGDFGDQYVERNREFAHRGPFWRDRIGAMSCAAVLEVGCNVGGNLQWIAEAAPDAAIYGVDVNDRALAHLRESVPRAMPLVASARSLPFHDRAFDLVFTMGVLIHQPTDALPLVMSEMVRTSRRYVMCGEYFAPRTEEVPYRGQRGALFKRDYGRIFQDAFSDLSMIGTGFLGSDEGWDDVTWWLFERRL